MTEEQNKEVMRLGELWAAYAWKACSHGADETVKSQAGRAALEAYLRTIGEPENTFPLNPNGASKWARLQKHDGAEAIGVVFRTGSGSVGSLVDGRVVWADWLAHPNGSKPESVNAELLEALKYARRFMNKSAHDTDYLDAAIARAESAIEGSPKPVSPDLLESARAVVARWDAPTWKDLPATAEYIGRLRVAIAQADLDGALTAEEWVVKNVSGSAGLVRAMVIRAEAEESAIETPAKVSPCAGHAAPHEVSGGTPGCGSE